MWTRQARLGWAIARETGASLLAYELYGLNILGRSIPTVHPPWTVPNRPRLPVLFIHGIFHNGTAFAWLKQKLALSGWRRFKEINLFPSIHSIPSLAEQTSHSIKKLLKHYGVSQVDVVAHSMGGIVARYFIQLLGGDGMVRHLITLGTPHQGTRLSHLSFLPHVKDLSPKSALMKQLNSCPIPRKTQATVVFGSLDILIQPRECAWWEGTRNIELANVGHAGLLFSRRVYRIIRSRLAGGSPQTVRRKK